MLSRASRRLWHSNSSLAKIVAQNASENEPRRTEGSADRAADLRFSDAWVIAHRNLNDAEPLQRAFQNNFHGPAISGFFECERTKNIRARGAERAEVRDPLLKQKRDQARCEPVSKCGAPGSAPGVRAPANRELSIRAPSGDRSKRRRKFGRCSHRRETRRRRAMALADSLPSLPHPRRCSRTTRAPHARQSQASHRSSCCRRR